MGLVAAVEQGPCHRRFAIEIALFASTTTPDGCHGGTSDAGNLTRREHPKFARSACSTTLQRARDADYGAFGRRTLPFALTIRSNEQLPPERFNGRVRRGCQGCSLDDRPCVALMDRAGPPSKTRLASGPAPARARGRGPGRIFKRGRVSGSPTRTAGRSIAKAPQVLAGEHTNLHRLPWHLALGRDEAHGPQDGGCVPPLRDRRRKRPS
jgi:hypothetical protein